MRERELWKQHMHICCALSSGGVTQYCVLYLQVEVGVSHREGGMIYM